MYKLYELLIDDEWVKAELTDQQVKDITNEINGECVINRQYDIHLTTGEIIDLGIVDDLKVV